MKKNQLYVMFKVIIVYNLRFLIEGRNKNKSVKIRSEKKVYSILKMINK